MSVDACGSRRLRGLRISASMVTAGAMTAGLMVLAAPAAEAAGYGLCGSGHKLIDSAPIGNLGTAYLTWNAESGRNCLVVVRGDPGAPLRMSAVIGRDDGVQDSDSGSYSSYAGPVYVDGRGSCIDWGGVIHDQEINRWHSHCG
ncbi:spore-associated protein A [Streptomyces sp. NBC_00250]|uniref:spore-associated protein A n=1 Tax=Streptomyces sp. NBC_00250 TaxID=2903641 RepID=UPI002E2D6373|nr:spore-associated protein A [Streptomyces sp. NBC_00250]